MGGRSLHPDYENAYVFENDFTTCQPHPEFEADSSSASDSPLLVAVPEQGQCLVVCFSPRHDLTLRELKKILFVTLEKWVCTTIRLVRQNYSS